MSRRQPTPPDLGEPLGAKFDKGYEPKATYAILEPVVYKSVYGYLKHKYPIAKLIDGVQEKVIGHVKEEIVPDEGRSQSGRVYYQKHGWLSSGQLRFYDSIPALLVAAEMELDPNAPIPETPPMPWAQTPEKAIADQVDDHDDEDEDGA